MSLSASDRLRTRHLQLVVGIDGEPTAVPVDLRTWRELISLIEDDVDVAALGAASADLLALSRGERPPGWLPWAEFEAELDRLEASGELPD
jgi:hypothetical protein